jgi:hypothetical protein
VSTSTLELRPTHRRDDTVPVFTTMGRPSPRLFLDLVVDGKSLYAAFKDIPGGNVFISCLGGWYPNREEERNAAERLLGRRAPDAPEGCCTIYVCSECADLQCGAIVVRVERSQRSVTWSDFGHVWFDYGLQAGDCHVIDPIPGLGPFTFELGQIESALAAMIEQTQR